MRIISIILVFIVVFVSQHCTKHSSTLTFVPSEIYPENEGTIMGFAFGDIDGDGLIDLVVHEGAGGGSVNWFKSPEQGKVWEKYEIAATGPDSMHFSVGDLEIGDIDNDNDIDVLAFEHPGEWSFDYSGKKLPTSIFWYENVEHGSNWIPHYIGEAPDFIKDVELLHLDSNNRIDLITITYLDDHNFSVFRQDSGNVWAQVQNFPITNLHEGMDSGDIDGDGDLDVAANGYWIENPGGNLEAEWLVHLIDEKWNNQKSDWRNNATKVYCKDINNDGRVEVFISHSEEKGYSVSFYQSKIEELSITWEEKTVASGFTAVHTLQVGDIDNDGDDDVLLGENGDHSVKGDDNKKQVRIFLNQGDNVSWKEEYLSDNGLYNGLLVDANGDSLMDFGGASGHEKDPYYLWIQSRENK